MKHDGGNLVYSTESGLHCPHCGKPFDQCRCNPSARPGDDDKKFAAWVLKKCISNDTLQLTSGIQQRDFIYIDDVLSAYEVILMNKSGLGKSQTISVGSGCPTSLRYFVETIHKYTQSRSRLEFGALPLREEESMYSCADIRELSRLEWKAKFTLEQGIASMIKGLDQ